ncbi:MAG: hypothetical protein JWO46_1803 [Nocardioidaceae bacterium]|nr:hypothetical protein [Nocardioidaceae bacterium]
MVVEKRDHCGRCGAIDSFVPIREAERDVTWDEHGGRKFRVQPLRCLACASREFVARVTAADEKKGVKPGTEPSLAHYAPAEGRYFAPTEITESAATAAAPPS